MKNSQYVNQFNIAINDMVRMNFNETPNGVDMLEVATLCMHIDYAEMIANAILETVEKHRKNIANQKANNDSDKELN